MFFLFYHSLNTIVIAAKWSFRSEFLFGFPIYNIQILYSVEMLDGMSDYILLRILVFRYCEKL